MAEIKEELKKVTLKGFEGYNLAKVFHIPSEVDRLYPKRSNLLKESVKLFLICFSDGTSYEVTQNIGTSLFLFAHNTRRKDVLEMFRNVSSCALNPSLIVRQKRRNLQFVQTIRYFYLLLVWSRQLFLTQLSTIQKIIVLNVLIDLYRVRKVIQKVDVAGLKLFVSFFDASPIYGYATQYFMQRGLKTATLQHGVVLSKRCIDNVDLLGMELENSIADYYLAWNKMTYKEALKAGKLEEQIKILGVAKCMDVMTINVRHECEKVFGVILDGVDTEFNNSKLIALANEIADKMNLNYVIKYHPNYKGNEYNMYTNNRCVEVFKDSSTLESYLKVVAFTILASSTVLIELVFRGHLVFHLLNQEQSEYAKYRDIPHMQITDYGTFAQKMQHYEKDYALLSAELCSIKDVKAEYGKFFGSFD